jgi:hypothetical protein
MPEIDLRDSPWNPGIPTEPGILFRDLYRLLAVFSASKEICGRRCGADDQGSVYGYSIRHFELSEVGRLLVSLAATCRNDWDYRSMSIEESLKMCAESPVVGELVNDLNVPSAIQNLYVRESWNKILHCHTMNFQRSEGPTLYSGHLEPFVHLYGEFRGKQWKATIDVFRWCEVVHALLD